MEGVSHDCSSIHGFIWEDLIGDGLLSSSETGINGIKILLYRIIGNHAEIIDYTLTTYNSHGQAGHFTFSSLCSGNYIIKVEANNNKYKLTTQRLDVLNGSLAEPQTGLIPTLYLGPHTSLCYIIAGVINFRTYAFITNVNEQVSKTMQDSIYSQILLNLKLNALNDLIDTMK